MNYSELILLKSSSRMGNTYSEGTCTGYITDLKQTGYRYKTWECEMVLDGLKTKINPWKGSEMAVPNTWNFSLDARRARNEDIDMIVGQLQKKMEAGERVTVSYWTPYVSYSCRGLTGNFVHKVK